MYRFLACPVYFVIFSPVKLKASIILPVTNAKKGNPHPTATEKIIPRRIRNLSILSEYL
jgi:hypothetical protein